MCLFKLLYTCTCIVVCNNNHFYTRLQYNNIHRSAKDKKFTTDTFKNVHIFKFVFISAIMFAYYSFLYFFFESLINFFFQITRLAALLFYYKYNLGSLKPRSATHGEYEFSNYISRARLPLFFFTFAVCSYYKVCKTSRLHVYIFIRPSVSSLIHL